jgi:hypothetical protein
VEFGISRVTREASRDQGELAERRLAAHRLDPVTDRADDGK